MESAAAENVKSKGDQRLAYLLLGKLSLNMQKWTTIDKSTSEKIGLSILFCVSKLVILKGILMRTKSPEFS